MRIITISGVDGSGKSTQAQRLIEYYTHRGERVYYLHAVSFSIAQKLLKKKHRSATATTDTGDAQTHASRLSVFLRKCALIVDIARFWFLKKKLARSGYTIIISDRFFSDTVVNIRYLARRTSIGMLEHIIPRTDKAFFLMVDPEVIMQRDRAPEQGLAYLRAKTALFAERTKFWNMMAVNADQSMDDVTEALLEAL